MTNKRYYWLKLNENFFEDDTIEWIEDQENGEKYVLFYLKLCLKSLKDGGNLIRYVGEMLMPYDIKALAKLTNTDKDTVAVALKCFEEIGLIERKESGEIYMRQIDEMIGSETDSAKRMRESRARQNALEEGEKTPLSQSDNIVQECDSDVQKSDIEYRDKSIEYRDKSIEIDIEIEVEEASATKIFSQITQIFQNNGFGLLTSNTHSLLVSLTKDYSDEWVLDALEVAVKRNKRSAGYVEGILKSWKAEGKDDNAKQVAGNSKSNVEDEDDSAARAGVISL